MSAMQNALKLCAAGGVAFARLAGTAFAAPQKNGKEIRVTAPVDPDTRTQRVSYKDLNLTLASHQRTLNGRVGRAVTWVCEPMDNEAGYSRDFRMCKSGAWGSARPQIALAIQRAHEIAATGTSTIPPVAIVLAFPSR